MMQESVRSIDRLVARAGQLYSLPTVAMKVLELTQNPTVDASAIKACIENDPALTIKLLRVVNSSLFGLIREVCDLNQALALLGTKPLKLLVLGFSLPSRLFAGVGTAVLARYWRRTLTKAIAARELCEAVWRQPGDEAFIGGLLQDLGMLLLIQELGEPYIKFLDAVLTSGRDLRAMEVESMGFDHTILTARLLAHWGLPEALAEAVNWPEASPAEMPQLAQALHLAELLAQVLVDGRAEAFGRLLEVGPPHERLEASEVEKLVATLEQKVQQLAGVLRLQLPENTDYRELLLRAHTQLAEVASDAAEMLLRRQFHGVDRGERGLLDEFQSLSEAVARVAHGDPRRSKPAVAPAESRAVEPVVAAVRSSLPPDCGLVSPRGRTAALDADPPLQSQLTSMAAACRQSRCSLSLLLVELDNPEDLVARYGVDRLAGFRRFLEYACRKLEHPCAICLAHGEVGFAVILPRCDRQAAVQLGNELIDRVRQLDLGRSPTGHPVMSISAGVATVALPPKNFPADALLEAADRCLYGAHASGGVLKSIEIY